MHRKDLTERLVNLVDCSHALSSKDLTERLVNLVDCTHALSSKDLTERLVNLVDCTHALSSHPLIMHLPGEIELDESTDARRAILARSSLAATSRGNGSRGGVSRSIVRMVREHAWRMTRATFSKPHHPDWVSLEAPPVPQEKKRPPPRTPLKPTFQNDKSRIDTQSDSFCTSEPRGSLSLSQPLRRTYAAGKCSTAFCCSSTVFTSGSWPASR